MLTEGAIIEELRQSNTEFRELEASHHRLGLELHELQRRHVLTPSEEVEKKRIQKEKLVKKDKLAECIRVYREQQLQPVDFLDFQNVGRRCARDGFARIRQALGDDAVVGSNDGRFLQALLGEWELYLERLNRTITVSEIHLGGGTPTMLESRDLSSLLTALREGFRGPVFIQGDHFQVNAKKYAADAKAEVAAVKALATEAIEAGFFNVDIDTSPGSAPDRAVVQTRITEKATGELTLGGGYSTDAGALLDIGLSERNFLGTGVNAGINGVLAQKRSSIS